MTEPPQPSLTCPHVMAPTHAVAAVFGVHETTQAPATHWSPGGQVPQTLRPPHRLSVTPHTAAPQPGFVGHCAGWQEEAVPPALKTQSGVAPMQAVPMPAQPSLTRPHLMLGPHAAAGVLGTQATTQAPPAHCCPAGQKPQVFTPPHRLLVSPHTAATQPGFGGHGPAWHDEVVPAALNTHCGVTPPHTVAHVTDPPHPSLTCPHVMPPTHAAATVFGTQAAIGQALLTQARGPG
jgi:hypothetical protein